MKVLLRSRLAPFVRHQLRRTCFAGAFVLFLTTRAVPGAEAVETNHSFTINQRLAPGHLQVVHAARERFAKEHHTTPEHGLYDDFPGIVLHTGPTGQSNDSEEQFLRAAKKSGIKILIVARPGDPETNAWRGLHDDVLFIPGSESEKGILSLPDNDSNGKTGSSKALKFLSRATTQQDAPAAAGIIGMEVSRGKSEATPDKNVRSKLVENSPEYLDEVLALASAYRPEAFALWDKEAKAKRFTGIGGTEIPTETSNLERTAGNYEVLFRNLVTHFLVRGQTEAFVHEALTDGRVYVSHDWLCDPTGFSFGTVNNLGVFGMGDDAPLVGKTRVMAITPIPAHLRLFLNGEIVQEASGTNLTFDARIPGACRVEAWLNVDGEERPWIYSNPIYLRAPKANELRLPGMEISEAVEVHKDISYQEGPEEQAAKHKLDVYAPKGKAAEPILFFIHGGAWKSGDRSFYPPLGNRYAKAGVLTVIPSYRLAPRYPHPAQIEDVAAAFAWTVQHAPEYGGDTNRIFVAGHSAGGHLAALLALAPSHLEKHKLSPRVIRGVMAWSGVYNLTITEGLESVFGSDLEARRQASPFQHVKPGAPRFMVSYCQNDYFSLPAQARQFYRALKKANVDAELLYVPGENHLSEMIQVTNPEDPIVAAALRFMK